MELPNLVIIDGWVYLRVGKCGGLRICTQSEVEQVTIDEFARMVQNAMATSDYHAISSGSKYVLH